MTEAKIPKTNTNWRSIDIYLFSNGQQYSPPRKYHLHSDELARWKSTLMHLARLHYGSLHSCIELYTLEGHKVNGPLELSTGNAYVAVEPPDLFIDSGYNKYMMKASRSWEKSQARKMITNEIIKSDERNNKILKLDKVTDEVSIETANKNTPLDMVEIHGVESIDTIIPFTCEDNESLKKFTPLLKATEKKSQPNSQNSTLKTKLPNSTKLAPKKRPLTIKNNQIPKTNSRLQNLQRDVIVNSENKVSVTKKLTSTPYKFKTPFSVSSKIKKMSNNSSIRLPKLELIKPVNNISTTDYVQTETTIFQNRDSELPSIMLTLEDDSYKGKIDEKQIHNYINKKHDIFIPIPEEIIDEVQNNVPNDSTIYNTNNCKNNSKIFIGTMQHEPNVTFSKENHGENCMIIDKGDIINFQLQIEVQKKGSDNGVYNKSIKRSQSLTNLHKYEKASQIHFDDEIFVRDKIQDRTLHSLLVSELNQFIDDNKCCKLVIIKSDCCVYCSYDLSNVETFLPANVNNRCFLLGPQRCQCKYEHKEDVKTDGNKENAKSTSIYNYLKKAITDLSLERLSSTEPEIMLIIKDQETPKAENKSNGSYSNRFEQNECTKFNVNQTEDENITKFNESQTGDENVTKLDERQTSDKNITKFDESQTFNETVTKLDENKTDDENFKSNIKYDLSETKDYENSRLIITKNADGMPSKAVLDKSIQTENSNLLLQARRQDDGHYTFHLPPLHLLKLYKIS